MPDIPSMALNQMHRAEKRYEVGREFGKQEAKQRQLRSILNKLTPANFEVLFEQVLDVTLSDTSVVPDFVLQIVGRAIGEPIYCEMYAELCHLMDGNLPVLLVYFSSYNKTMTVKKLVLNECQRIFERGFGVVDEGAIKLSEGEREYDKIKTDIQMLGNIQFIGELYKKTVIPSKIIFHIIQVLLEGYQGPDEKNIEALCLLMTRAGILVKLPDYPKAKKHLDAYFVIMERLSTSQKLSHRIRFMLMVLIDLRRNEWQRKRKTEKPKKTEDMDTIYRNGLNVIDLCSSDENDADFDDHFSSSSCLDAKIQRKERMAEEDCYILEPDACQSLTTDLEHKVALTDDSEEDVCIISEKGQVACRDYPHPRHLCAQYPFNFTNHENSCAQCYCYVCDERAPCELWEGQLGHCHASDKEHKWIDLRAVFRLERKI